MKTLVEWMCLACALIGAIGGAAIMDEWLAHKRRTAALEARLDSVEKWKDEADKVLGVEGGQYGH